MISNYPGSKLRTLRRRANLTQMEVVELTGIHEDTIRYLEHGKRRPQTATLDKLLNLYAIRIARFEKFDKLWGEDGLQRPVQPAGVASGNGAERGRDSQKQALAAAGNGVSSHAQPRLARPWESRVAKG